MQSFSHSVVLPLSNGQSYWAICTTNWLIGSRPLFGRAFASLTLSLQHSFIYLYQSNANVHAYTVTHVHTYTQLHIYAFVVRQIRPLFLVRLRVCCVNIYNYSYTRTCTYGNYLLHFVVNVLKQ